MKLLLLLVLAVTAAQSFRYDGYRVVQVGPLRDVEKMKMVAALADNDERVREVILMNEHLFPSEKIVLAVAPKAFFRVSEFLDRKGIHFVVTNDDLQKTYDEEKIANENAKQNWLKSGSKAAPSAYLRYDEQVNWMNTAVSGSSIASTFNIGQSYEGRDMIGVRINHGRSDLPAIWLDSNIHAREWISSATMLYIVNEILTGTSANAVNMRNNYRWYILPNANPDGYEFTHTSDRMWRKTRSPNSGSPCIGTDPNRNWDANWGGPGSSNVPCQDTYAGSSAFSEIETANMRDFITTIASFTNVGITIHSYSQLWLVPWGGYSYKPADYNELMRVGNLAASAIQGVNGLRFTVGTPPDILYVAAGGSFDWFKEALDIAYSYAPELRPATEAQGGFDIPASNIHPSGAEIFAAVVAVAQNANHKV